MIYIKDPGAKMWGYRCKVCGREILSTEQLKDLSCTNCGMQMVNTNIPKEKQEKQEAEETAPEEPAEKPPAKKKEERQPDGCRNCVFSRKGLFQVDDYNVPGFKCFKDNRTHSPTACCSHYRRRGRAKKEQ
jgi:DNA-directed RNA polymerase subunit RPC12/RpoP